MMVAKTQKKFVNATKILCVKAPNFSVDIVRHQNIDKS
jgi:hypothetical protein